MKLAIRFNCNNTFLTGFKELQSDFFVNFGEIVKVPAGDVYTGEYEVIPRIYQQQLATKDKQMVKDVTVEVIPFEKITNPKNGYTVIIG